MQALKAPLLILVAVVGCAPAFTTVPNDDWQAVAPARRATVDKAYDGHVAQLQQELRAANAAVAAAPKAHAMTPSVKPAAVVAPGDDWAVAMQRYEHDKTAARTQIDAASVAWQEAVVQYQRERIVWIERELDEARAQHELDRANTINRMLDESDVYETAGYRGQLAQFQTTRFEAEHRVDAARTALQRAAGQMTAAKETYATLVRTGPMAPTSQDDRLQLEAFAPTTRYERSRHHDAQYLTAPAQRHIATR
ncbi:MAG TPA: hypothetical protein VGG74_32580 [Kofleriaceae bacterium]|jgi:hypothetical protein